METTPLPVFRGHPRSDDVATAIGGGVEANKAQNEFLVTPGVLELGKEHQLNRSYRMHPLSDDVTAAKEGEVVVT